MRFLLALIGYAAVATVLSGMLLFAFLWTSDRLNDEKMFRIVALIHDIDLNETPNQEGELLPTEAPVEEPSQFEIDRMREIALRNLEVKESALQQGKSEFDHLLQQLTEASGRFDGLASELEERIRQESELSSQESVSNVVRDLKSVKPDKAKDLLLRILAEGGSDPESQSEAMDDVIRLMNAMPSNTLTGILKKFQSPEELTKLHEIHRVMLDGGPKKKVFDEALDQIKSREYSP